MYAHFLTGKIAAPAQLRGDTMAASRRYPMNSFWRAVLKRCVAVGWTLRELADHIGVAPSTLYACLREQYAGECRRRLERWLKGKRE